MAIVEVIKEVVWMRKLLSEFSFTIQEPIDIYTDNQSAIKILENDCQHDRSKHIEIKYHFIRDEIKRKRVLLKWIDTENQVADIFTKGLGPTRFDKLRNKVVSCITIKEEC